MHLKNPGMRKKHPEGAGSAEKALCGPLQKAQPTRRVMGLWQLMWDLLAASTYLSGSGPLWCYSSPEPPDSSGSLQFLPWRMAQWPPSPAFP